MAGKDLVYWDCCAFLALLKNETQHGEDELPALRAIAYEFDTGVIFLASSTVTLLEVLSANLDDAVREKFEGVVQRSNFVKVEASEYVMRLAAKVRRYYHGKLVDGNGSNLIVSSADAIHIASGLAIGCQTFITLDVRDKPNKREAGLLKLASHGPILGSHKMQIQRPSFGSSGGLFALDGER